jgi:hypothetical protein
VATHFSRLLRHACVTVGLFLFPGHHTGKFRGYKCTFLFPLSLLTLFQNFCKHLIWKTGGDIHYKEGFLVVYRSCKGKAKVVRVLY